MPKLQRKSAKVFAEQAQAGVGGVGQFGSLAAGDPQYSKDVDVIQALDAYKNGWSDAVVGNKSPAIEDRNALDYLLSYQQAYIMQHGIPEWLSTETYYKNCYVVDSNGLLRYSLIDNNTGNNPVDDSLGQVSWAFGGARGTGKSVGEVYFSQSSSAVDNPGALPLWTGELISNANSLYPQFYAWVASHTNLCVTQAQYDARISQYGECPFYVITSTTIRLPKLVNYLKMASGSTLSQSEAGLPNITGSFGQEESGYFYATGAFARGESHGNRSANAGGLGYDYNFNASRSSSVYGTSNTVTPAHTTLYPWVYAYNQAVAASTAQAAEFQAALSSKADVDLANCTRPYITETYSNGTSWYRVWSDGWCEQGGQIPADDLEEITVTFLKPYTNSNYSFSFSLDYSNSTANISYRQGAIWDKTSTSFKCWSDNTVVKCWQTKGYIS